MGRSASLRRPTTQTLGINIRMLGYAILSVVVPIWVVISIISLYFYYKRPVRGIPIESPILRFIFYIVAFTLIVLLILALILVIEKLDVSLVLKILTEIVIILFLPLFISWKFFYIAIKYENTQINQNIVWVANQLGVASLLYVPAIPLTMLIYSPLLR